jgi:hypothetical protein
MCYWWSVLICPETAILVAFPDPRRSFQQLGTISGQLSQVWETGPANEPGRFP